MTITIEGKDYTIPGSLSDVTLGKKIEFDNLHGKDLREQLKKIIEMKDGLAKDIEFTDYHCQLACRTLSFFGDIPLNIVQNTSIDEVLTVYHHTMSGYGADVDFTNKDFEMQEEFHWNDEVWLISAPELTHDSKMTFGEFLDAKQWVKNLYEVGQEKFGALHMLCCIYFRKKDERYSKDLSKEAGDRYKLLKALPLEYALHVGFFLSASMNSFISLSQSLGQMAENPEVSN